MTRIVVALGGNAISRAGEAGTWEEARENARSVVAPLARMASKGTEIILTHGNGPQVGNLLLQQEATREVAPLPLDALGAATEGWIGYLLQQELGYALSRSGVLRPVIPVVTRVEVSGKDPAFAHPTKPIGRYYSDNEARLLTKQRGWTMVHDMARGGWRRVVPSPHPQRIVEGPVLRRMLEEGFGRRMVLLLAGGGGVPVVAKAGGRFEGVEAVIDKDRTAALLARSLGADELAILTDVDHVSIGFRTPRERRLGRVAASQLRTYLEGGEFGEGSMRPKVEAALSFISDGGRRALITDAEHFAHALQGTAGTIVESRAPDKRRASVVR
ncbi:MAG: carbamate kinase [Euryarchaeota archaeon]|nr:carbamate kinase [Euryarchaeota archaeon]MDE1836316.1 carbamate kinase [Euryarchaeota archaeon]MDE1879114.1 carbamate kinase [Euryarchaeota archaeon]MDE2044288.1 carbamate kinase [Thermoplasmata archaeon]